MYSFSNGITCDTSTWEIKCLALLSSDKQMSFKRDLSAPVKSGGTCAPPFPICCFYPYNFPLVVCVYELNVAWCSQLGEDSLGRSFKGKQLLWKGLSTCTCIHTHIHCFPNANLSILCHICILKVVPVVYLCTVPLLCFKENMQSHSQ